MKCPHCKGSGKLPEKEWRVRKTTVREVIVMAGSREEAVEKSKSTFGGVKSDTKVSAAPLKPIELCSPWRLGLAEKDGEQHICDGVGALCEAETKYTEHRLNLDQDRLCEKCKSVAITRGAIEKRRVI
jgi:hypothetical protein